MVKISKNDPKRGTKAQYKEKRVSHSISQLYQNFWTVIEQDKIPKLILIRQLLSTFVREISQSLSEKRSQSTIDVIFINLQQQQMSKIEERRNTTDKDKMQDCQDRNLSFLRIMYNQNKEEQEKKISEQIKKVSRKIQDLSQTERLQWSLVIYKKCEQLLSRTKLKQANYMLKILVNICSSFKIQYDKNKIEEMLKHVYLQKYGNQAINFFQKAGYSTREFQLLQYQDPWYIKIYRYVSNIL